MVRVTVITHNSTSVREVEGGTLEPAMQLTHIQNYLNATINGHNVQSHYARMLSYDERRRGSVYAHFRESPGYRENCRSNLCAP